MFTLQEADQFHVFQALLPGQQPEPVRHRLPVGLLDGGEIRGRASAWASARVQLLLKSFIRRTTDAEIDTPKRPTSALADRPQPTVEGGVGPVEGVGGMDAATKPPWMGLRRPPQPAHPAISRIASF
jgi:hypothetical protein